MTKPNRPMLCARRDIAPVESFIQELQDAIDTGNAELFNRHFAEDVLWGSPFGAIAEGYSQIHAIHSRMFASVVPQMGASRYIVEHAQFPTDGVAIVYVRRLSNLPHDSPEPGQPGSFDELALLVIVRRDGQWWLSAAQHVPDRRDVYSKR